MPPAPAGAASASAMSCVERHAGRNVSRAHCNEPAAESITPMACQPPGTAWQKTCTRACGSGW